MDTQKPTLMTVRQIARTGILPEHALRALLKSGRITAVQVGRKAYINYDTNCRKRSRMGETDFNTG